ncbi:MAG: DUF3299 domain-containing protein [Pseudomonadota bacterium]
MLTALLQVPAFVGEPAQDIAWPALVDQTTQDYEDPYRDLDSAQIRAVVEIARIRSQLKNVALSAEQRRLLSDDLRGLEMRAQSVGIDVDHLISQRWEVAERRRLAATAGNTEIDGLDIRIAGFIIPAPPAADGRPVAYLVPERGMCSHMPPPPPNQMIRVRMSDDWSPTFIYQPVRFTGRIALRPSAERIMVVDGLVTMNATFELDATAAEPLLPVGQNPPRVVGHRAGTRPVTVQ